MLASPTYPRLILHVRTLAEARLAMAAGIERLHVLPADLAAIRATFDGVIRVEGTPAALASMTDSTADEITVEVDVLFEHADMLKAWRGGHPRRKIVAQTDLHADLAAVVHQLVGLADTIVVCFRADDKIGEAACILDRFATSCRAARIRVGFSGSLEAPDIARLLLWSPDEFEVDSAVRTDHVSAGAIDTQALDRISALVGGSSVPDDDAVIDRLFVRDLVVSQSIGAYKAEHAAPQRVRFSVEADVARSRRPPRDMGDIFSYDLIIDTIRLLADRGHVAFVEQLAEEIATALLAHSAVQLVRVTVEKLDIIAGSVGITIERSGDAGPPQGSSL